MIQQIADNFTSKLKQSPQIGHLAELHDWAIEKGLMALIEGGNVATEDGRNEALEYFAGQSEEILTKNRLFSESGQAQAVANQHLILRNLLKLSVLEELGLKARNPLENIIRSRLPPAP